MRAKVPRQYFGNPSDWRPQVLKQSQQTDQEPRLGQGVRQLAPLVEGTFVVLVMDAVPAVFLLLVSEGI